MATWNNVSEENYRASKLLFEAECYRACASRSYYAAYAAATSVMRRVKGARFVHGGNPSHGQLLGLIRGNLRSLGYSDAVVKEMTSAIRHLRRKREEADYVPGWTIERTDARDCLRDARSVLQTLGVIQ